MLIVEVNENMPRVFGENIIHVSEVDAIVENHVPLIELKDRPLTREDEIIGSKISEMVPDGACLQFGIGGIPNAVAKYLSNHKDLGIHTEMLTNCIVDLHEAGAITNNKKNIHPYKTVFTLCWGSQKLYDFIDDNPAVESYPSWHINDPAVIEQNDNVISVNSIIEIDLFGQVNSESIGGGEFSGVGGQRDFMSGAFRSKGGMSFLAFYSTAKEGTISKIVPSLTGLVSDSRMEPEYMVTEHGMIRIERQDKLPACPRADRACRTAVQGRASEVGKKNGRGQVGITAKNISSWREMVLQRHLNSKHHSVKI